MNRIIRFFPNSDLRNGHLGLAAQAKKQQIDVTSLKTGEFVMFANASMTGVKIFCPNHTICYVRSPDGRRIEMKAIRYLPLFFSGTEFNYTKALEKSLMDSGLRRAA